MICLEIYITFLHFQKDTTISTSIYYKNVTHKTALKTGENSAIHYFQLKIYHFRFHKIRFIYFIIKIFLKKCRLHFQTEL